MMVFDGLLWIIILVGPLLLLQRRLHYETQAIFLLLTRRSEISLVLFSLLFFPGVLLHEASHYLMARLLGVRTGRFSLIPSRQKDGRLRLGYVETHSADIIRDALIGSAPLLAGGVFVGYVSLTQLGVPDFLGAGLQWTETLLNNLASLHAQPDFWMWFYLTFAVSSTMLPSASDRRAWLPLGLSVGLLLLVLLLAGAGPWMAEHLALPLNQALRAVSLVMAITVLVHLVLLLPLWIVRRILNRVTGLKIVS